jgi:hypothetical protein
VTEPANFVLIALFSSLIQLVILALIVWLILRFVRAFEKLSEAAMGIARIYERQHNLQQKLHKQHDQP